MADEITGTVELSAEKGGSTMSLAKTMQNDLEGVGIHTQTLSIGTSAEQITWPADLTSEGITLIAMLNLDTTNYVEVGGDSGLTVFKLKIPKESAIFFAPSSGNPTIYAKADTAACNVVVAAVGT